MTRDAAVPWPTGAEVDDAGALWLELAPTGAPSLVVGPDTHALTGLADQSVLAVTARMHPDDLERLLEGTDDEQVPRGVAGEPVACRVRLDDGWWRFEITVTTWDDDSRSVRVLDLGPVDGADEFVAMLDAVPVGVVAGRYGPAGLWANRAARELLGLDGAPIGRAWLGVIDTDGATELCHALDEVAARRVARVVDVRTTDDRAFEIRIAPWSTKGWICTLDDVTARTQAARDEVTRTAFERQLASMVADVVIVCNDELEVTRTVGMLPGITAFDPSTLIGRRWRDILVDPPEGLEIDRPDIREGAAVRAAKTGLDQTGSRVRLRFDDGQVRHVDVRATVVDITDTRQILIGLVDRTRLADIERRVLAYAQLSAELAVTLDSSFRVLHATPRLEAVLGVTGRSLQGSSLADRVMPVDAEAFRRLCEEATDLPDVTEAVIRFTGGSAASHRSLAVRAARDTFADQIFLSMLDVTDDLKDRDRLTHLAAHDSLTGLANRRQLELFAPSMLASKPGALALIDIDRFKEINDTLGHNTGDAVLVAFANRLVNAARGADLVVRHGGDEFVVVMPGVEREHDASALADRLLGATSGTYRINGVPLEVSSSVGVARLPAGIELRVALDCADALLYSAKRGGRARACLGTADSAGRLTT